MPGADPGASKVSGGRGCLCCLELVDAFVNVLVLPLAQRRQSRLVTFIVMPFYNFAICRNLSYLRHGAPRVLVIQPAVHGALACLALS